MSYNIASAGVFIQKGTREQHSTPSCAEKLQHSSHGIVKNCGVEQKGLENVTKTRHSIKKVTAREPPINSTFRNFVMSRKVSGHLKKLCRYY